MNVEKNFIQIYDQLAPSILRHIYFRVNNNGLAEDLMQETFTKTWQYIVEKPNEIKNLKVFLYKVADNLVIDHYRQKSKTALSLDEIGEASAQEAAQQEKSAEKSVQQDLLNKHLKELPEEQRQILIYRYVNDLSVSEISDITKKTKNNVSVIIHRGLKTLKEKLNNYDV